LNDDQVLFARALLQRPLMREDVKRDPPKDGSASDKCTLENLKRAALKPDTNEFDTLIILAAEGLYQGDALPDWLATFAADVLTGKRVRPTRRGADKYRNFERDYGLWRTALEVAKRFNLPLYTNNELSTKTTAAEVVGKAANLKVAIVTTAIKKFNRISGEK
jgi:hypothetical protein